MIKAIRPITNEETTIGDWKEYSLAKLKPRTIPPNPSAEVIVLSKSIFGLVNSNVLSIKLKAKIQAMAKNTAKLAKIKRHEAILNKIPAKVGPTAGANIMINAAMPIAAPNF